MRLFLSFYIIILLLTVLHVVTSTVTTAAAITSDLGINLLIVLLLLFMLALDIKMHSPPRLYGSSRTTGGILRGNTLGNTMNTADFDDIVDVLHPISGKVLVYSSNQDPANLSIQTMKPSTFIKHNITSSIQPVLKKVAEKYSPIQSE